MNNEPYEIANAEQLKAFTSPVRNEIIDIVAATGPLAVADMATALGRAADSLYYHVRTLVNAGLLIPSGTRKAFRQTESIYDVPGRPMLARYDPAQPEMADIMVRSIAGMLRLTERNFRHAYEQGLVKEEDGERNVIHARALGWYTPKEIRELRSRILAVFNEFESEHRPDGDGKSLFALTSILVPLDANPAAPRSDSRGEKRSGPKKP